MAVKPPLPARILIPVANPLTAEELIRLGVSDPARATERMAHWQQVVFSSADAQEGARAFIERRPPVWQGR